jgi:hypothetical protein
MLSILDASTSSSASPSVESHGTVMGGSPLHAHPFAMPSVAEGGAQRLVADKIGSSASGAVQRPNIVVTALPDPQIGNVVAVQVSEGYSGSNVLELGNGRLASLKAGDVVIGVLGRRMALKGFVGEVPESLEPGDPLHILNLGGVIGRLEGGHQGLAAPTAVTFLGAVTDGAGPVMLAHTARAVAARMVRGLPLILVAGTCMNAGKTKAAAELIGHFTREGLKVAGAKMTGVACLRDLLLMQDLGAVKTLSFLDFGLPSTVGVSDIAPLVKGVVNGLAEAQPDVAILELGDGILGGYGVESLFADDEIMEATAGLIVCANDFLGAWGAIELLKEKGVRVDAIAGSATDSPMAVSFIEQRFGVPAANALTMSDKLSGLMLERLKAWRHKPA